MKERDKMLFDRSMYQVIAREYVQMVQPSNRTPDITARICKCLAYSNTLNGCPFLRVQQVQIPLAHTHKGCARTIQHNDEFLCWCPTGDLDASKSIDDSVHAHTCLALDKGSSGARKACDYIEGNKESPMLWRATGLRNQTSPCLLSTSRVFVA